MVAESIYLRTLKLNMDKGSDIQTAVPKSFLLLLVPKPQEPAYPLQSLSYETVCKNCCLQSCSRIFSDLIWDALTMTCCLRRSRFSYRLLVHLIHQYFNTSAQLYFSTWIVEHGISSDEKSSCKVLNSCQPMMWTQLSVRGTKPPFFFKFCKL